MSYSESTTLTQATTACTTQTMHWHAPAKGVAAPEQQP